jgi:hypothetical protein
MMVRNALARVLLANPTHQEAAFMLRRNLALLSLLSMPLMLPLWAEEHPHPGQPLDLLEKAIPVPFSGLITPTPGPVSEVAVAVETGTTYQTMLGFGSEYVGINSPPLTLRPSQLGEVLTLAFGQVQLTMGDADQLLEAPGPGIYPGQDSNPGNAFSVDQSAASWGNNPTTWSTNGWQGWSLSNTHNSWIAGQSSTPDGQGGFLTAKQLGFTDYFLGSTFPNLKYENPWLAAIRDRGNLTDYRNKVARQVLAYVVWYQNMYGEIPALMQFGNEEWSGIHALFTQADMDTYPVANYDRAGVQEMVDLIYTSGARLQANTGSLITLTPPQFIVGREETVGDSYEMASAVLTGTPAGQAPGAAAPYAGAIAYGEYPYGGEFSNLANLLADAAGTNDAGTPGAPSSAEIAIRGQIRDLGAAYHLPLILGEVSHGTSNNNNGVYASSLDGNTMDALRGRAIDIHYNLIYANISAFILQGAYYDTVLEAAHTGQNLALGRIKTWMGPDFAVLGDPNANGGAGQFDITTGGYAIGHYARWVKKGDVRVAATSTDPLVMVTAFTSAARGTVSFILINNSTQPRSATFSLSGNQFNGNLSGEQSTNGSYWSPLGNIAPSDATDVTITLPALSVTSLSGPIM